VVITDGAESYAVFTYMCELIQWSGLYNYPTIGFSAAGAIFANHPLTGREEASNIDCIGDTQYNNVAYKISVDPSLIEQKRRECLVWYFSDIESYGNSEFIAQFSENQTPCPCSWLQAWWDRRYQFFTRKQDSFCFIERFPNMLGGGQECCYSNFNPFPSFFGVHVLRGISSGGLLRYHPYWSDYFSYTDYDRFAQETCCPSEVGYCRFYHERRPPNNCARYVPQTRSELLKYMCNY